MTDLSIDRPVAATPTLPGEINTRAAGLALAALLGGAFLLAQSYGWRQGALYLLGGALGITLYHALFGFTSAFRVFIADRRGAGLRAQMLMATVLGGMYYLLQVIDNPSATSLPDVPPALVAIVGGSHAIYLGGKARDLLFGNRGDSASK